MTDQCREPDDATSNIFRAIHRNRKRFSAAEVAERLAAASAAATAPLEAPSRQTWEVADELCKQNPGGMLTYHAEAFDEGVASVAQPVPADRRPAWFDALTARAEAMGFVSLEDALDGFDAMRKAAGDRALQPVQPLAEALAQPSILIPPGLDFDEMRAFIVAHATQDAWKRVPVEPTEAMMDAAEACSDDWPRTTWAKAYKAMLDAAPVSEAYRDGFNLALGNTPCGKCPRETQYGLGICGKCIEAGIVFPDGCENRDDNKS